MEGVIQRFPYEKFALGKRKKFQTVGKFNPDSQKLYMFLAIQIRIFGLQNAPKETIKADKPLRLSIKESLNHFKSLGLKAPPGINICERLSAQFNFEEVSAAQISNNFLSVVVKLGYCVSGDEKLVYFNGSSCFIKSVPSKPDKVGLWFY